MALSWCSTFRLNAIVKAWEGFKQQGVLIITYTALTHTDCISFVKKSHVSGVTEVNGALNETGIHLALDRKYKKREQGFYGSFSGKKSTSVFTIYPSCNTIVNGSGPIDGEPC